MAQTPRDGFDEGVPGSTNPVNAFERPEFKLAISHQYPLSEIQTMAEKSKAASTKPSTNVKRRVKIRARRTKSVVVTPEKKRRSHPAVQSTSVASTSSSSSLVSEAYSLAISKGLRSGFVEFLRCNTDASIKQSFEEVKKELMNRQSFLKSATSVVRYLQAARVLYNRLSEQERRKYELAARKRARVEHKEELAKNGVDDEMPLFINGSDLTNGDRKDAVSSTACVMPPSEHLFKDSRSTEEITRFEVLESRKLDCPLCTVSSEKIMNAVEYQSHMLEHHPCAHLYACHFCGIVFPSCEALKTHDGCEEFAASAVQRILPSGEFEFRMRFAIMILACTDCGSQFVVSSSFIGESSWTHWDEIIKYHMVHNMAKVVPLVVYSEEQVTDKVCLRFKTVTPIMKGIELDCSHCGLTGFDTIDSLESHLLGHERCPRKKCPECSMEFSQEAFFREHLVSHLDCKSCYLAMHLANVCTFITKGVPSCGQSTYAKNGGVVYGGVSSAIFTPKMATTTFVDQWESVTCRKKANRRGRKRKAGPAYQKDPDEEDAENIPVDETVLKLRKLLGASFDPAGVLKVNGFFYTEIHSKDETEESSKRYNSSEITFKLATDEQGEDKGSILANDIAKNFSQFCRLAGGKPLEQEFVPIHKGLFTKVLMCRRCQCLCFGDEATVRHLSKCCPDLRKMKDGCPKFDLEDGLLVFCVFPGNSVPNARIHCWECALSLCSLFGLRVHMAAYHGVLLRIDEDFDEPGVLTSKSSLITKTTRAINLAIGLTEDGCLPVNLEQRRRESLASKLKSNETSTTLSSTITSPIPGTLLPVEASASSARRSESPAVIVLDEPPPSVQVIECGDSAAGVLTSHDITLSAENGSSRQDNTTNVPVSIAEVSLVGQADVHHNYSTLICSEVMPSEFHPESVELISEGARDEIVQHDTSLGGIVEKGKNEAKSFVQCEFCCLTMNSEGDLQEHLKYHTEFPKFCFLCDPPRPINDLKSLSDHLHAYHASRVDSSVADGHSYEVCSFCKFQMRGNKLVAHLVSECYMAPCPLCGNQLQHRNDRVSHKKIHKEVSERFTCKCRQVYPTFTAFQQHTCRPKNLITVTCASCKVYKCTGPAHNRNTVRKKATLHVIEKHTKEHFCCVCKSEPLEALREHVQSHVVESSAVLTPKPTLHACSEPQLLKNTVENSTYKISERIVKIITTGDTERVESSESNDAVDMGSDPVTTADGTHVEDVSSEGDEATRSESSRDGNSPPLLEKQREVLAGLLDDLQPPPSVMILENVGAAEVREERQDTPTALPKSSVADDSDDEVLIVDAQKERKMSQQSQSSNSKLSTSSPVVHSVNTGDEDCMMLEVVELPSGVTPHSVSASREKKFKCSMCSETFLRKSTCTYHELHSHRNDIISDICDEPYGIPLDPNSVMYLCQQCVVAFEDPQRARRHLAQHMNKAPAYPCEKCSSICLTESNLKEHHKKHDEGRLSYRCLRCTPNQIYSSEYEIYYHLHIDHSIPLIAFCKNCLVASANLDSVFVHVVYRECSGTRHATPRLSMITLQRSMGFGIASELYYQPNDEARMTNKQGHFATPSMCSHRSFISFGDSFTTCPEDPSKCFGMVNQNRWHSYLCATNKNNPGEMPSSLPDGKTMRCTGNDNMLNLLLGRFKNNGCLDRNGHAGNGPSHIGSSAPSGSNYPSHPVEQRRSGVGVSTCEVVNRRQSAAVNGGASSSSSAQTLIYPTSQPHASGGDMVAVRQALSRHPTSFVNQATCLFCRRRDTPMICEPPDRAYEAVSMLCTKFREVHPNAAQSLFSALNSFIRETHIQHSGRALFCFCRWHYSASCFDSTGRQVLSIAPSNIDSQILLHNFHSGLLYPDPDFISKYCSSTCATPCSTATEGRSSPAGIRFSGSVWRLQITSMTQCITTKSPVSSVKRILIRCVLCTVVPPSGSCRTTSFIADHLVAVPGEPAKEKWAQNICLSLVGPGAQDFLKVFRASKQPKLCIRHFNPRALMMSSNGMLMRCPSTDELPCADFAQYASLSGDFNQALNRLIDGMDCKQNTNTIAMMLKIVQELVKCSDERCGRMLNTSKDVQLHQYHQLPNKFVCLECFSRSNVLRTEQDMIEHCTIKHCETNAEDKRVPVVYALHCPLRSCKGTFPSVQLLRKHINHEHSAQFPMSSDNCATRFYNAAKMSFHNGVHERYSHDVTCCYLCGVADPWQRELSNGIRISHELVHAMKRFVICKTCMAPMGHDPTGVVLIDHFMHAHMLDQPKRVRYCKVCRQSVIAPGIAEHILEQHRLIAFRPRYASQSQTSMLSVMNGSELCVYLGVPNELCKPNPLAESAELG
ncbi:hypothetical protein Q1695_013776 [Nippostrongylus brasiliensis]|nr:hypothetical protein Q1695_013776 [Nippostrongylus brasiliensis]